MQGTGLGPIYQNPNERTLHSALFEFFPFARPSAVSCDNDVVDLFRALTAKSIGNLFFCRFSEFVNSALPQNSWNCFVDKCLDPIAARESQPQALHLF
jgi:hypothetical protein